MQRWLGRLLGASPTDFSIDIGAYTTEDRWIVLSPCRLFDACLRVRSLAAANISTESSRTCSFLIEGSNPFSKTAIFSRYLAKHFGLLR